MTLLWRIATDGKYSASDMTGGGAKETGGRWNHKGIPVIYTATNISLACLETMVHLGTSALPLNRYLIKIEVPDDVLSRAYRFDKDTSPVGWDALPSSRTSIEFGSDWCKKNSSALMFVPSVIIPEELNVLINPNHPDAELIKTKTVRKWLYDQRVSGRLALQI